MLAGAAAAVDADYVESENGTHLPSAFFDATSPRGVEAQAPSSPDRQAIPALSIPSCTANPSLTAQFAPHQPPLSSAKSGPSGRSVLFLAILCQARSCSRFFPSDPSFPACIRASAPLRLRGRSRFEFRSFFVSSTTRNEFF